MNHNLQPAIQTLKKGLEEKAGTGKEEDSSTRDRAIAGGDCGRLEKLQDTAAENRTEVEKYLAAKFERLLKVEPEELKSLDAGYRKIGRE